MGTVFAPNYENLNMEYHESKFHNLIEFNYNLEIRQYFVENWKRWWLWNTYQDITPDDLLAILNSINNAIQFSMELNDDKLPFLDILITKPGKKNLDEHLFKTNRFKTLFLTFLTTQNPALRIYRFV